MRGDLVERRYSDEELRSILEDATRSQRQPNSLPGSHDGKATRNYMRELLEILKEAVPRS